MPTSIAKLNASVGVVYDPTRSGFHERFFKRPGLNADLDTGSTPDQASINLALRLNQMFEVKGTNATSALATHPSGSISGVTLTTAGASGDQMLLAPHEDSGISPIEAASFLPSAQPGFYAQIKTGASVADTTFIAGLKLTETPVVATDADAAYFRYEAGSSSYLTCVTSIGGTDVTITTDIEIQASTFYEFFLTVDSNRKPIFGVRVSHGALQTALYVGPTALTAAAALKPVAGVEADAAAAKAITVTDIAAARLNV